MKKLSEWIGKRGIGKFLPLLLIGVLLLLLAGALGTKTKTEKDERSMTGAYSAELEERVEKLCKEVDGAGDCRVMITVEGKVKRTYSGDTPVYEEAPKVVGVTVVCEGGGKASVRRDLTELLTALFDIGSNRVSVLRSK